MNWIKIIPCDYDTYPKEGIDVLVSDGLNYDVAYYVMSQTYKWLKVDIDRDEVNDFNPFIPTKWCYID